MLYDEDGTEVDSDTTTGLSVRFDDLVPCRMYNFTVRAFNDAGYGSFAEFSEEGTDSEGNETSYIAKCVVHATSISFPLNSVETVSKK